MVSGTCKTCKHAEPLADPQDPRFVCRRFPPQNTAFIGPMPNGQPGIMTSTNPPLVDPNCWCGEYGSKITAQN